MFWFSFCNPLLHTQTRGPLSPTRLVTEACLTHLACRRGTGGRGGGPYAYVKGSHLPVLCSGAATCSVAHLSVLVCLPGLAADVSADLSECCFFSLMGKKSLCNQLVCVVYIETNIRCNYFNYTVSVLSFVKIMPRHQPMPTNERNGKHVSVKVE